jgi:hypothetical protein
MSGIKGVSNFGPLPVKLPFILCDMPGQRSNENENDQL